VPPNYDILKIKIVVDTIKTNYGIYYGEICEGKKHGKGNLKY
jgi:hypothetical protein